MKRVLTLFVALVLTSSAQASVYVRTYTAKVNGVEWTYTISDGKACIYSGGEFSAITNNISGRLTIPSTLGGCQVTSIGAYAFYNCSGLTSVTMKGDCPGVGSSAFYNIGSSCVV